MNSFSITGRLVDVHRRTVYPAEVVASNGRILSVKPIHDSALRTKSYLLPGFIDSHVHIESSMLVPSEFARLAVVHGTVATVSDPHEIANVCGMEGVDFMIENGKTVPFKFYFGAPSCVPATSFETAGATLDSDDVEKLLKKDAIKYLSEMMNFPGVLNEDEEVMKKIAVAHRLLKPVDGHAPGLRGEQAKQYIAAGITTDHECFTREEALDKLQNGMKVIIREGSAAKNFEALIDLLNDFPNQMMFCSDDKHPDSLVAGHINQLCARAVAKGIELFKVLRAACVNPVLHYKLGVGLLREGDPADFIAVKDLEKFEVEKTFIDGELVSEDGKSKVKSQKSKVINNFSCNKKKPEDFVIKGMSNYAKTVSNWFAEDGATNLRVPVIEARDGQLITNKITAAIENDEEILKPNIEEDILKIVVVNRYKDAPPAKAFIKNFGMKKGAIASTVAHDSHNIVAVGVDDESICRAVNLVIEQRGGLSAVGNRKKMILPLPLAGLMSIEDGYKVAAEYTAIDKMVKTELGSTLSAPFMTLSFMALLVIPHLKLSDMGLFDGDKFEFV
jgi:adenine deaminase